ncbi:hypothetical protein ACI3KY_00775 [Microbacterium sp. ZW T2_14]|uniref:hypothetical protein n=1 Tax=Microbacterium sp. ZW T2_14 TaxID=3378079 RepID=UPI003851B9C0
MDWGVLVVIGVAVWIAAAVLIGLLIGRMIRYRDGRVPETVTDHVAEPPEDRRAA